MSKKSTTPFKSTSPNRTPPILDDQANGGNIGAAVVGDAFGTLYPLGTGTYTETMTGDVDTFTLSLDSAGEAFAISQINSGGLLRIIATPADLGVQATYAGAGHLCAKFGGGIASLLRCRAA